MSRRVPWLTGIVRALVVFAVVVWFGRTATGQTLQQGASYQGRLEPATFVDHFVPIDVMDTAIFGVGATPDADLVLFDPDGHRVDGTTPGVRCPKTYDGGSASPGCIVPSPAPGLWTVRVVSVLATAATYSVSTILVNAPIVATLEVSRLVVHDREKMPLRVVITDAMQPATGFRVSVTAVAENGAIQRPVVVDDGSGPDAVGNDGAYHGWFGRVPASRYRLTMVTGKTPTGHVFARAAGASVRVVAGRPKFLRGMRDVARDGTGEGGIDQIVLDVPLRIAATSDYRLTATLEDVLGESTEASRSFVLTAGDVRVELPVDASIIGLWGGDGPYRVTRLVLRDERVSDGQFIGFDVATRPGRAYRTQAYDVTTFDTYVPSAGVPTLAIAASDVVRTTPTRVTLMLHLTNTGTGPLRRILIRDITPQALQGPPAPGAQLVSPEVPLLVPEYLTAETPLTVPVTVDVPVETRDLRLSVRVWGFHPSDGSVLKFVLEHLVSVPPGG